MMTFVQSYACTHAHAYPHTPMRICPRTHIGSSLHEWGPAVLRQLHDGFLPRLFLNEPWNWNRPNVYILYTHGMIRQIAGGRFTTKSGY